MTEEDRGPATYVDQVGNLVVRRSYLPPLGQWTTIDGSGASMAELQDEVHSRLNDGWILVAMSDRSAALRRDQADWEAISPSDRTLRVVK